MIAPRFLVDENLSVLLPQIAHERGFEATHIVHLGLRQSRDWNILEAVRRDGWVLVTNNAVEFRSRFRLIDVHPGVIFLLPSLRREQQQLLFAAALENPAANPNLTNQAMDVGLTEDAKIVISRYALP